MDELLSFMGENFEGGAVKEDHLEVDSQIPAPTCGQTTSSPLKQNNQTGETGRSSPPPSWQSEQNVTYQKIFGSPVKRNVKKIGLSKKKLKPGPPPKTVDLSAEEKGIQSSVSASSSSWTTLRNHEQFKLSKAIKEDSKVPYKPDRDVVIDPYSRIRVIDTTISTYFDEKMSAEAALKARNLGMEYVSLATFAVWYRGKGTDQKNFWVSGVLSRKTPVVRKSSKGNKYLIWELCDLKELDKRMTLFLFGSAASPGGSLAATPCGSVVDVTTPSVMQDASGTVKLSVSNESQVSFIAQAKDFGLCQATKNDGKRCAAVVNKLECCFCIHHVSGKLKNMNMAPCGGGGRGMGKGRTGGGKSSQQAKVPSRPNLPSSSRMALQGGVNTMNKNPVITGNADNVQFFAKGGNQHPLLKEEAPPLIPKKPLDLNPKKTRHLTDKDRELLSKLAPMSGEELLKSQQKKKGNSSSTPSPVISELIAFSIVSNPTTGGRNFLQFLSHQHAPKEQADLNSSPNSAAFQPTGMSREKLRCIKKALDFVKKNGPIKKADPNATTTSAGGGIKRKLKQTPFPQKLLSRAAAAMKKSKTDFSVEFDFESEGFEKILNAKSTHDEKLEQIQQEEYFGKLEKNEALENKLPNTFSIDTNAVMCRKCKYVNVSQSNFCKQQLHKVRLVKACKKFFKCKGCGNRTMSLDRLPKQPCNKCNGSSWLVTSAEIERKVPTLPSEVLSVRENE